MENFSERLNELLVVEEINPKVFAENLGVSLKTVYSWKSGKQQIYLSNLVRLCECYNCTMDFISGRSEYNINIIIQPMPPYIMSKKGVSTYRLDKDKGYSSSYFVRWKRGQEPYLSTLIDIADYFECTIDELVGREL